MIPDGVEKIIMTKEDYDRNVEQLLYDKVNAELEVERLNNIINKVIKYIENHREAVDERNEKIIYWLTDDFDEEDILNILKEGEK